MTDKKFKDIEQQLKEITDKCYRDVIRISDNFTEQMQELLEEREDNLLIAINERYNKVMEILRQYRDDLSNEDIERLIKIQP
jgi:uncharacterized protein YjgD (DUF1641 family)